jgi:hypothetical protein
VVQGFDVPARATAAMVSAALGMLVDRHETLRTTFHQADDGEAYQVVHPARPVPLTAVPALDPESEIARASAELKRIAFDLAEDGLIRAALVSVDGRPVHLLVATHHVVVDGWSWGVLRREFDALVRAALAGTAPDLPPVAWQPLDQAEQERSEHGQRANAAALAYWERQLMVLPDRVLPAAGVDPSGQHIAVLRSPAMATALSWLSAHYRIVESTLVLAALGAVLGMVTGRDRSVVMTMSTNRRTSRTRDLVACLAQYTVVNVDLLGNPSFAELIDRAGAAVLVAYRHGHYDFAAMKALERSMAQRRGIVFSQPAGLNFKRYVEGAPARTDPGPVPLLSTVDSQVDVLSVGGSCARGVVLLSVRPGPTVTELELLADGDAVSPKDMADLVRAMESLLLAGMAGPDLRLSDLATHCDLHRPVFGPDWALVDHCWVRLTETAAAIGDCPGVTAAFVAVETDSLVAYVAVDDPPPAQEALERDGWERTLREYALRAAKAGQAVIAPHRYVLCRTAPADPLDLAAWQHTEPLTFG